MILKPEFTLGFMSSFFDQLETVALFVNIRDEATGTWFYLNPTYFMLIS